MSVQAILAAIDELSGIQRAQLINNLATTYLPDDGFVLSEKLEQELDKVEENWRKDTSTARPFREVMKKYLNR